MGDEKKSVKKRMLEALDTKLQAIRAVVYSGGDGTVSENYFWYSAPAEQLGGKRAFRFYNLAETFADEMIRFCRKNRLIWIHKSGQYIFRKGGEQ